MFFIIVCIATMMYGSCPEVRRHGAQKMRNGAAKLELLTKTIPASAVEFARKTFLNFVVSDLTNAGHSTDDVLDLKLGSGFSITTSDGTDVYYFPAVSSKHEIIAFLTVAGSEGAYGWEYGHYALAAALSDAEQLGPFEVLGTPNGYYSALSNGSNLFLTSDRIVSTSEGKEETERILSESRKKSPTTLSVIKYEDSFINPKLSAATPAPVVYMGKVRDVPFVKNGVYNQCLADGTNCTHGICWASTLASILIYEGAGVYSGGVKQRDLLVNNQVTYNKAHPSNNRAYLSAAGISDAKRILLDNFPGSSFDIVKDGYRPAWSVIKTQINAYDAPFYSAWGYANESAEHTEHAMVIRGYSYDDTDPNDTSRMLMFLMDPNDSASCASNGVPSSFDSSKTYTNVFGYDNSYHIINGNLKLQWRGSLLGAYEY